MGKYLFKLEKGDMSHTDGDTAMVFYSSCIANELAEANRLKRMEIALEYPTRTELGFTLVKNEQLEDQA